MKTKTKISLFFGIFLVFALGSFVTAIPILTNPLTDGNVNGANMFLNATNGTLIDLQNCTFFAKSPSTGNTTFLALNTTFFNTSVGALFINGSFDSTELEDANDYSFKVACWNDSEQLNSSVSTSVLIDNSVPIAGTSLSPSDGTVDDDGSVLFNSTVDGGKTTSCTLQFDGILPSGGNSQAMSHIGNFCSLTISAISEQTYNWFVRASDGTNTTDSSTLTFAVDSSTGTRRIDSKQQQESIRTLAAAGNGNGNGIGTGGIIAIVIVGIGLLVWIFRKK